jgi:hypothetical protein
LLHLHLFPLLSLIASCLYSYNMESCKLQGAAVWHFINLKSICNIILISNKLSIFVSFICIWVEWLY